MLRRQAARQLARLLGPSSAACTGSCPAGGGLSGTAGGAYALSSSGGGGSGSGSSLLAPLCASPASWRLAALQPLARLHTSAPPTSADAADGAGPSSPSSSSPAAAGASQPGKRGGRPKSPVPHIDTEQLLHSLGLSGAALPSKLLASLRKLSGARQSGVLEHAAAVVKQLCSSAVGLTGEQAGRLLEARPLLFSWPPEEGAALQLGQLRAAGLTVEAAVSCLLALPAEGGYRSFEDGLAELADILAHSADRESSHGGRKPAVPAAQRTTAALLTLKPAVIRLVLNKAGHLQQCSQQLQQAGWSAAEVAALVWYRPSFLASDSVQRLQQAIGVLVQQLGLTPAEVVGAVISIKPSWLTSSIDTLGRRAAALAEGFGQSAARSMFKAYPNILGCAPEVWRRNLVYMEACGVSGPSEVLAEHCKLVNLDHAAPAFLQRRLLLQRGFGLTPAQLYGQRAWSLSESTAPALAQRLQFVQHRGQLQRLAATGLTGGAASRLPPHQRPLSLRLLLVGEQADLLEAVGATAGDWASWAAANPPEECALYREAQQAAEAEAARLTAALPHELQAWQPKPNSRKGARRKSAE